MGHFMLKSVSLSAVLPDTHVDGCSQYACSNTEALRTVAAATVVSGMVLCSAVIKIT